MAKKVIGYIKLQVKAGQANPSPPVGPALGQRGLNIMEFCKAFNAATQKLEPGLPIPVIITAYSDRTLHLHHEDAAGDDASEEGGRHRIGFGASEHREGRQGHAQAARRDRQGEGCPISPRPISTPPCAPSRAAPVRMGLVSEG